MGNKQTLSESENIQTLILELRELIRTARHLAARSVNTIQVLTNFEVGHRIVEFEQKGATRAKYGGQVLKTLAKALTIEFGKGFSETNLKLMRQFYLLYHDRISQTLSDKLLSKQKSQALSDLLRKPDTASRKSEGRKMNFEFRSVNCENRDSQFLVCHSAFLIHYSQFDSLEGLGNQLV